VRSGAARLLWLGVSLALGVSPAHAGAPDPGTEVILWVKPAVALVMTEVSGTVRLVCPSKGPQEVAASPVQANGSGFLITPDGYLVTNGHVVQPYVEEDPDTREAFIREAIGRRCLDPSVPEAKRRKMIQELYPRIAPAARIDWKKTLTVVLSNRERFVGEVKAYSPPLQERPGRQIPGATGQAVESGKDVAILKIDASNLPTIPFGDSDRVQVGQPIWILGYPGVVLYHDLLDKRSAVEATVTGGHVSSLKRDTRGAPVIQTDAAASWGNSGGPAVDDRGQAVGILTFISLTADETQSIQGFNFLVPANVAREFARAAGAPLGAVSAFNIVWHDAVTRYMRGDYAGAQSRLDAANRLVPGLPDVKRLQAEVELQLLRSPAWPRLLTVGGPVLALLVLATGTWLAMRRWAGRGTPVADTARMEEPAGGGEARSPVRVSAADLGRALAQRVDLLLLDVRSPSAYSASAVQAKGARRAGVGDVLQVCAGLPKSQGIVLYCHDPGEALSAQCASILMGAGFTRVAVLAGGFDAWLQASLPLERTVSARSAAPPTPIPALPAATSAPPASRIPLDVPLGVKGSGPYFNARTTSLGMTGLSFSTGQQISVGQRLQLTVFTGGDALELRGVVEAVDVQAGLSDESVNLVSVKLDPLADESATALEGYILSQRTLHSGGSRP
jgi:S1-C subfamily serine protease/rhodanese-related sulfurtransferase